MFIYNHMHMLYSGNYLFQLIDDVQLCLVGDMTVVGRIKTR